MKEKCCSICQRHLPLDHYHRRRHTTKSGYRAACKACTRDVARRLRADAPPSNDPEAGLKTRVRAKTRHAIKQGLLCRQPCEICGAVAQAHHPDYRAEDSHLRVHWLCALHHAAEHGVRPWTKQLELPKLTSVRRALEKR